MAMEWRASVRNLRSLMSEEYHRRHTKSHHKSAHSGKGHPKGKGKGRKH